MISFTTFILTLLTLFSLSLSAPMRRDVFRPSDHVPPCRCGLDSWSSSQCHLGDRWCTRKHHQRDRQGISSQQLHHDLDHPLATGFNILDGRVTIQVPSVATGRNYSLVLFGDSGNYSHNSPSSAFDWYPTMSFLITRRTSNANVVQRARRCNRAPCSELNAMDYVIVMHSDFTGQFVV
ncbi:hypothetical protein EDB19DRAFT_224577 [Suillus lakei]|nr:hypothetical protein EDB19DRAFT_224577 [Suillus lakei]